MGVNGLFTFGLFFLAVVVVVIGATAVYVAVARRRGRGAEHEVAPADRVGPTKDSPRGTPQAPPREFYKSMGLETAEEMKLRLYTAEEYRDELGGEEAAVRDGGFVAAIKAYRQLDDEWYDYNPNRAADILELAPEDYEVDGERMALLVRRLPPGMPISARDAL